MKVFLVSGFRLTFCENKIYAKSQYAAIIKRYYEAFGQLGFCCRMEEVKETTDDYEEVSNCVETFIPVKSYAAALLGIYNAKLLQEIEKCDLLIARCPDMLSFRAVTCAKRVNKAYFAEVMGCAWDALWNHSILGKIIAPYMFFKMKKTIKNANYALYVTNEFLQKRYPCRNESVGVSNVRIETIEDQSLEKRLQKIENMDVRKITLMTTAAVDVRYKGQEYVIRAIPLLNKLGVYVKYIMIGGGSQDYLLSVAKKYGVEGQLEFKGRLPLNEVFQQLDDADIYIQPSLQEGLPRSVVEAMSRGCPVIGAKTGGIPELLDSECIVKRKSAKNIADAILNILNKNNLVRLAEHNFLHSKLFLDATLATKRSEFYARIKEEIEYMK